ncbi:MAG: choice-of-anchor A family protein [Salinisphaera sp.]|jgi:choice-of-anchor A domain-containing protein|nr:choice-of-anchor A family protein [Salinisphaera sp.]
MNDGIVLIEGETNETASVCFFAVAGMSLMSVGSASASMITGGDILSQFNLVVLGNLDSHSHVDGRTYVGGNLTGSSADFFQHGSQASASDYAALTVGGNITGGDKKVNSNGNAVIGGNVESLTMNGGTALIGGRVTSRANGRVNQGTAVTIPDFSSSLRDYSLALAGEDANSSVSVLNKRATFTGLSGADLSVFNISGSLFSQLNEIQFSVDPSQSVLINVTGDPGRIAANFLGNYSSLQPNLLWNFSDATNINFDRQFRGSILAPQAAIRNSNNLEGSVAVNSFEQYGEVHQPIFANNFPTIVSPGFDVAEPPIWPLFAFALAGIAFFSVRRRRGVL